MLGTYKLVPVVNLGRKLQLQVLKIRNEKHIREWLFTQEEIIIEDHFNWIEKIKNDQSQVNLVIVNDKMQPLGSVNLKKIDMKNKNAELGFYMSLNNNEKGLMTISLSTILNYSFDVIGIEKIYSEVFEGNSKSINIHKRLAFIEEGFLRSHTIKDGVRIGVHLFGLMKDEWQRRRDEMGAVNNIVVEF